MFSKKLESLPVETKPAMSEDKDIIKELTAQEYDLAFLYWNKAKAILNLVPLRLRKTALSQRYCRHSPGDDFIVRIAVQIYDSLV